MSALMPRKRILAYALPTAVKEAAIEKLAEDGNGNDIVIRHFGSKVSFLDFEVVLLFAGVFERFDLTEFMPRWSCVDDLDGRAREWFTAYRRKTVLIFLIADIPDRVAAAGGSARPDAEVDLFRRVAKTLGIAWKSQGPMSHLTTNIPEFIPYIEQYGTSYTVLAPIRDTASRCKPISKIADSLFAALVLDGSVFFLPARRPRNYGDSIEIATAAITAVLQYQQRVAVELPAWTSEFVSPDERRLANARQALVTEIAKLDEELLVPLKRKRLLVAQSDPLKDGVQEALRDVIGFKLHDPESNEEDLQILGDADSVIGIIEVKGENGNVQRKDVNQADTHRNNRGLPDSAPALLIMNTLRKAACLKDKDQAPHANEIKRAVSTNVLILRTLDLLYLESLIQTGRATAEELRRAMLTECGWLHATAQAWRVVKQSR